MFGEFGFGEPYFGEGPGAAPVVIGPSVIDLSGSGEQVIADEGAGDLIIGLAGGAGPTVITLSGAAE